MKYTYLLIDILSLLVPFVFSFHPKINFYRYWKALIPAVVISAALFIPFDSYFTNLKVWGFNPAYVTGFYMGNLPIEELLFFICIPYSCVFTYHCLSGLFSKEISVLTVNVFTAFLILACAVIAMIFHNHAYTIFTFMLTAILLGVAQFIWKVQWLTKFYFTYVVLLLPFLIVNGILTGTGLKEPIVWYNNAENMNVRILTIPAEDVFYGMSLILLNLLIFNALGKIFYSTKQGDIMHKPSSN